MNSAVPNRCKRHIYCPGLVLQANSTPSPPDIASASTRYRGSLGTLCLAQEGSVCVCAAGSLDPLFRAHKGRTEKTLREISIFSEFIHHSPGCGDRKTVHDAAKLSWSAMFESRAAAFRDV